jgi:CRISPR-associated exonuclease Cas4
MAESENGSEAREGGDEAASPQPNDRGIWIDADGHPLPVSASDLERHTYCPLSWKLAREGVSGEGEGLERGIDQHQKIHEAIQEYHVADLKARREMIIWTWWFAVVVTLSVDGAAFFFVGEGVVDEQNTTRLARYLALLALVWLLLAILLLVLPWRRLIGRPFGLAQPPKFEEFDLRADELEDLRLQVSPTGGWMEAGRTEVWLMLGSVTIALHAFALFSARERTVATFVLFVLALAWTFIAAWRLHRGLLATFEAESARESSGMKDMGALAYSDDQKESGLLVDEVTGLRGRPDQVVIIDGQYIPVEQKTGKVPIEPHMSHKVQLLAYLQLVSATTNSRPSYGILRYSDDTLFQIPWTVDEEHLLLERVSEVQRLMVEGGAKRDHERPGKCRNCSRRHACSDSLV